MRYPVCIDVEKATATAGRIDLHMALIGLAAPPWSGAVQEARNAMKSSVISTAAALCVLCAAGAEASPIHPTHARALRVERRPKIQRAIKALHRASIDLSMAKRGVGLHRARALQLTNEAMHECRAALSERP